MTSHRTLWPHLEKLPPVAPGYWVAWPMAHFRDALKGGDCVDRFIHVFWAPSMVRSSWEMIRKCVVDERMIDDGRGSVFPFTGG